MSNFSRLHALITLFFILFLGSTIVALPLVAAFKTKDAYLASSKLATLGKDKYKYVILL